MEKTLELLRSRRLEVDLLRDAVEEYWGEPCSDFDEGCCCCRAWQQYTNMCEALDSLVMTFMRQADSIVEGDETIDRLRAEKFELECAVANLEADREINKRMPDWMDWVDKPNFINDGHRIDYPYNDAAIDAERQRHSPIAELALSAPESWQQPDLFVEAESSRPFNERIARIAKHLNDNNYAIVEQLLTKLYQDLGIEE